MRHYPWMGWLALMTNIALANDSASGLKVLSLNFNSEDVPVDSKSVARDLRFAAIQHWVHENDPDIILIQEGWNFHSDPSIGISLARAIGYDVAYRLGMGFPGYLVDSNAILTRKSLHMSDEQDVKLPHSAPEIGDGKTWVVGFGAVTWAVGVSLTLPDGNPLYVYTSHLIGSTASDRADQLRTIDEDIHTRAKRDGVAWQNARIILGGDFNSTPSDAGPVALVQAGYTDSFDFVHPGDKSCTDCADPNAPFFNPTTIGAELVPNQADETNSDRFDYIFSHGPGLKAVSSTLIFTAPYRGVWMSDHYGVVSEFGDESAPVISGPVHDHEEPISPPQILRLNTDHFLCSDPWGSNESPDGCLTTVEALTVDGPRGVTLVNRSDFYVEVEFSGPGDVFTSPHAPLNPGESAAFAFDRPGEYTFTVKNLLQSPNPYRAQVSGTVHVHHTGY